MNGNGAPQQTGGINKVGSFTIAYADKFVLKGSGNSANTPEEGDWRFKVDANNNLDREYRDGGNWNEKEQTTPL